MDASGAREAGDAGAGDAGAGGSRRRRTVEVLIVGAGPAGLTAAATLAAAGAGRVEVLER
ncbi:FAD-dependent monooxygenase, partial [Streptomyces sp. NPDC048629]|uniref:FAD-dependent monooxygenase n=1 Tax=Streptomyces sp. NPDC048629 TaxID=3154824 RepID=UPI00343309DB